VAYLVPWGTAAAGRFLVAALDRGVEVLGADAAITLGGRKYPRGTLVLRAPAADRAAAAASDAFAATIAEIAKATGAEVIATSTSWVEEGISFGSDRVTKLRRPIIALAWDEPTSGNAAGAARWVLERRLGLPVTAVRTARLASADLDDFDVVILPDGDRYARVLRDEGAQSLERFVDRGGVLIAMAGAVEYLASPGVSLLSTREETRASAPQPEPAATPGSASARKGAGAPSETKKPTPSAQAATPSDSDEAPATATPTPTPQPKGAAKPAATASNDRPAGKVLTSEKDYLASIEAESAPPDVVPGVLVRAAPDPDHWLTVGVPSTVTVMAEGSAIFSPLRLDQGTNALHFAGADDLVASGYLWKENRAQLAWKPFVLVEQRGRGFVIGFTADPTFRGVLAGMDVLLLNAVVRAPAHVER
jgi:hypothetical protein